MYIPDKYLEVFDDSELNDYLDEMRRCVAQKDVEGFDEIIIKFEYSILEKALEVDKKIVTQNYVWPQTQNNYILNVIQLSSPTFYVGLLIYYLSYSLFVL